MKDLEALSEELVKGENLSRITSIVFNRSRKFKKLFNEVNKGNFNNASRILYKIETDYKYRPDNIDASEFTRLMNEVKNRIVNENNKEIIYLHIDEENNATYNI